jgi:hypothetical protein
MFIVGALGLSAVFISASTAYVTASRSAAPSTAGGQFYKRTSTATPLAQNPHAAHQGGAAQELPLVVDGNTAPEQIPDWIAFRHFMLIVAPSSNATSDARARADAHLDTVGLSPRDRAALLGAVSGTRAKLDDIGVRRRHLDGDTSPRADGARQALRAEEKTTFDDTHKRIRRAMSLEGGTRLSMHLNRMKKNIVIRGSMPQF